MPTTDGVRKSLDRAQARRLEDMILSDWPNIERDRPTKAEYARKISGQIGQAVSEYSIMRAAQVFGKHWPAPRNRIARMKSVSLARGKLIEVIAEAVITIAKSFGENTLVGNISSALHSCREAAKSDQSVPPNQP